jgi:tyrosine-protein kinase Etk/Wzc
LGYFFRLPATLAQLVERLIRNEQVIGSNPVSGSTFLLINFSPPARARIRSFGWAFPRSIDRLLGLGLGHLRHDAKFRINRTHGRYMSKNRELTLNMLEIVQVLAKHKLPILAFAFTVAFVTAIVSLIVEPRYRSQTVLLPPSSSSESSFGRILNSTPLGKLGGVSKMLQGASSDLTNTYMSILNSRSLRMDLIREFNLGHVYEFDKKKKYFIEDLLKEVNKNVSAGLSDDDGTIIIDVEDKDPVRAAKMAAYMVTQLETIYIRLMTEKNRNYRIFLGQRLDSVNITLKKAEEDLVRFQKKHRILDVEEQGKATITTGVSMEARFITARTALEIARKTFSEDHPKVRELKTQLEQMDKVRQEMSKGRVSEFLVPFSESQDLGLEFLRLKREFEIQQTILEFMVPQYEEAKFEESKNTPNVQILDPAEPPQKRIFPKRGKMVLTAFAISFIAACIAVLLANALQQYRTTNPENYARVAGVARSLWTIRSKR